MDVSTNLENKPSVEQGNSLVILQELNSEANKKALLQIVQDSLKLPEDQLEKIANGESFRSVGADSLDVVELVMNIEENFSIEISDEAAQKMETLQKAQDYITEHSKKGILNPSAIISDYNFDLQNLQFLLTQKFNLNLPVEKLEQCTVEKVCELIHQAYN